MPGRRRLTALFSVAALAVAGCGDDAIDTAPASTTSSTTETTDAPSSTTASTTATTEPVSASPPDTTGLDDEAQIRAVAEFEDQLVLLIDDPTDPLIARFTTGAERERIESLFRQVQAGDFSSRGRRITQINEVNIVDDRADAFACVFSDIDVLDSSGAVVDEGDGTSVIVRFELVRESGMWRVTDTGEMDSEGQVTTCELTG